MKDKLSNLPFALLCVLLLCIGLGIGAVRGWSSERAEILSALTQEGEMRTRLEYRGMDAGNLAIVAARHLPAEDPRLLGLREAAALLLSGTQDTDALLAADAEITRIALQLAQELPQLSSMQESRRDSAYLASLTGALSRRDSLTNTYTLMVEDFNQRLSGSLMGKLAMLLGVKALPVPVQQ